MNNVRSLYLLMALAVFATGGRFWAQSSLQTWEDAVDNHERQWEKIWTTCEELAARRDKAPKGSEEQSFRLHFQNQAYTAHMGTIEVQKRTSNRNDFEDLIFTIDFQDEDALFDRQKLRLFLFNSELLYPRMRTTGLAIQAAAPGGRGRALPTGSDRDDLWKVTKLEFKRRSPTADEKDRG